MDQMEWLDSRKTGQLDYLRRLCLLCEAKIFSPAQRLRFLFLFCQNFEDALAYRRQKLLARGECLAGLDEGLRGLCDRRDVCWRELSSYFASPRGKGAREEDPAFSREPLRLCESEFPLFVLPSRVRGGSCRHAFYSRPFYGEAAAFCGTDGTVLWRFFALPPQACEPGKDGASAAVSDSCADFPAAAPGWDEMLARVPFALLPSCFAQPGEGKPWDLAAGIVEKRRSAPPAAFFLDVEGGSFASGREGELSSNLRDCLCVAFPESLVFHGGALLSCSVKAFWKRASRGQMEPPRLVPSFFLPKEGMLSFLVHNELLLGHPFDSMKPLLLLLGEAARSQPVKEISISIYRLAQNSQVAALLCEAARRGKRVEVYLEPLARGDEERNLYFLRELEAAGCRVYFGKKGQKLHCKLMLLTLEAQGKTRTIAQVSTGNANEDTARRYVDLRLFTPDREIAQDISALFSAVKEGKESWEPKKLVASPQGMEPFLLEMIEKQRKLGEKGYLFFKVNALTSKTLARALVKASQKGVKIDLAVRGACILRPGIPGVTEHIRVFSALGYFLQHDRVYWFGKGKDRKIYLSSADLMARSLRRRLEAACPVEGKTSKEKLAAHLKRSFEDAVLFQKGPDGSYRVVSWGRR